MSDIRQYDPPPHDPELDPDVPNDPVPLHPGDPEQVDPEED